jgi:hypothetical protein
MTFLLHPDETYRDVQICTQCGTAKFSGGPVGSSSAIVPKAQKAAMKMAESPESVMGTFEYAEAGGDPRLIAAMVAGIRLAAKAMLGLTEVLTCRRGWR